MSADETVDAAPLVLVEWEDSARPVPSWSWLSEWEWESAVICRSVGWLIQDDDRVKALAPNIGEIVGERQVCGVIRIPARAVLRIVPLGDPVSENACGDDRASRPG